MAFKDKWQWHNLPLNRYY